MSSERGAGLRVPPYARVPVPGDAAPPDPDGADVLRDVIDHRRAVFSPGVDALIRELHGLGLWSSRRWCAWVGERRRDVDSARARGDAKAADRVIERMQAVLARERSWLQSGHGDREDPA